MRTLLLASALVVAALLANCGGDKGDTNPGEGGSGGESTDKGGGGGSGEGGSSGEGGKGTGGEGGSVDPGCAIPKPTGACKLSLTVCEEHYTAEPEDIMVSCDADEGLYFDACPRDGDYIGHCVGPAPQVYVRYYYGEDVGYQTACEEGGSVWCK